MIRILDPWYYSSSYDIPRLVPAAAPSTCTLVADDFGTADFERDLPDDDELTRTTKDNTGARRYREGVCFPTVGFPPDHALLATTLAPASPARGGL